jgi:hypothetical protein
MQHGFDLSVYAITQLERPNPLRVGLALAPAAHNSLTVSTSGLNPGED